MNRIDRIRAFNRFYTNQIGLLNRVIPKDFNLTEARVLYEIGSQKNPTARKIVGQLGMDEGYLSRTIKGLQKLGLIDRKPSSTDARIFNLGLTKDGLKNYQRLVQQAEDAVQNMIMELPDPAVDQLLESMDIVQGTLSWPDVAAPQIRTIRNGDVGWVVKRHGELYAANQGFDITFEALVAKILSEFVEKQDQPRENGWISETDGVRLGSVFVVAEDSGTARLRLMLVEPFARGKGIGQSLVETAINHAKCQGFDRMILWTQKDLKAACRLYERNGFQQIEESPSKLFGREVVNQSWELKF